MKGHIALKQFRETIKNHIEKQNASLVSFGITITHKYKQIEVLTQNEIPKPFYQRVLEYILHFFSRSQSNGTESVLVIQFKPIKLPHQIECKEYAFGLPIKNGDIPSKTLFSILKKVNRLIHRLKAIANKKSPKTACKATAMDTIRYVFSEKYAYKRKSNGINLKTIIFLLIVLSSIVYMALSVIFLHG